MEKKFEDMSEAELEVAQDVYLSLSQYLRHKRLSLKFQKMNLPECAADQEELAARIYSGLPEWAKR